MSNCYVCDEEMDISKLDDLYCSKKIGDDVRVRHLWHGAPGLRPYYKNRAQAVAVELPLLESGYTAPEVKQCAKYILASIEKEKTLGVDKD